MRKFDFVISEDFNRSWELSLGERVFVQNVLKYGKYSIPEAYFDGSLRRTYAGNVRYVCYPVTYDRVFTSKQYAVYRLLRKGVIVKIPPSQKTLTLFKTLKLLRNFETIVWRNVEIPVKPVDVKDLSTSLLIKLVNQYIEPKRMFGPAKRLRQLGLIEYYGCKVALTRDGIEKILRELENRLSRIVERTGKGKINCKREARSKIHYLIMMCKRYGRLRVKTGKIVDYIETLWSIVNEVAEISRIRAFEKYVRKQRKHVKKELEEKITFTIEV